MKNNIHKILTGIMLLSLVACKSASQKWMDGLTTFSKLGDTTESVEILKLKPADTSSLNYSVRIYPGKQWLTDKKDEQSVEMNYQMDSCIYIRNGGKTFNAAMIQPIANGLTNCFEYLVSFDLEPGMKGPRPAMVYQDKFISKKQYTFQLNTK